MRLKEALRIIQTLDEECRALNKELERRRDSIETEIAAQVKQEHETAVASFEV